MRREDGKVRKEEMGGMRESLLCIIAFDIRNSRFCLKIFLREQPKPNQSE